MPNSFAQPCKGHCSTSLHFQKTHLKNVIAPSAALPSLLGFSLSSNFLKSLSSPSLSYLIDLLIPQHASTWIHLSWWHGALAARWHANITSSSASQSGISNNALRDTVNCTTQQEVFPGRAQTAKWRTCLSLQQVTHDPFLCRPPSTSNIGSEYCHCHQEQLLHADRAQAGLEN